MCEEARDLISAQHTCILEADIFSGIPRVTGMGNKIATNHMIGTGEEKI